MNDNGRFLRMNVSFFSLNGRMDYIIVFSIVLNMYESERNLLLI